MRKTTTAAFILVMLMLTSSGGCPTACTEGNTLTLGRSEQPRLVYGRERSIMCGGGEEGEAAYSTGSVGGTTIRRFSLTITDVNKHKCCTKSLLTLTLAAQRQFSHHCPKNIIQCVIVKSSLQKSCMVLISP